MTLSHESPLPMNASHDIVLAFSGGLDTSFCVPYLKERGWNVHTVFADTGGVDAEILRHVPHGIAEQVDDFAVEYCLLAVDVVGALLSRGKREIAKREGTGFEGFEQFRIFG